MANNLREGFVAPVIVAIVVLALTGAGIGGYYVKKSREAAALQEKARMEREALGKKENGAMMEKGEGEMMEKKPSAEAMEGAEGGAMMEKGKGGETMMKYSGEILAGVSSLLLDYNKADYDAALKSDNLVVLYFYANWCPICKAELPELYAAFNDLKTDAVIGFRVNYNDSDTDDNERNLAREFGVAYQHTKVFVRNGERLLKSPEGWDKSRYLAEINRVTAQ